MDAYLVSHNGMGDNLYMIGALNYIKLFYKNVYFLCKSKYYKNVKLFFDPSTNIICLPFDEKNEMNEIKKIITSDKYVNDNIDIFVSGNHKGYLKNKITNKDFLNCKIIDKKYTIDWDTINSNNYSFIEGLYKDINLNLTYYYEYFYLPSTDESKKLYESVNKYYLIFIQYKSSTGETLNISNLIKKYINDDNSILLCNDMNLYPETHKKHPLAQHFVYNKIINYLDTIKNCDEIYLIDSCFIGIVLPLLKTNKLKTKKIRIILRSQINKYIL